MTASLDESPENHFPTRFQVSRRHECDLNCMGVLSVCLLSSNESRVRGNKDKEELYLQLLIINMMVAWYEWWEDEDEEERERWERRESPNRQSGVLTLNSQVRQGCKMFATNSSSSFGRGNASPDRVTFSVI